MPEQEMTPKQGESQDNFVSRCISAYEKADPERNSKQIQAICYDKWRKARGGE